jgi:hypothetical protein
MRQRHYADFDLTIEDLGEGRFRATVIDSPSGQARGEFGLPFSDLELENFLLRIGRPRSGVRRLESPETEAARAFGTRLFEAVFSGDVGRQWVRSIDAAEREEQGLRLRLRLSDAPGLADVPWEYLYSPSADDFVVLSSWTPVVRYISLDKGAPPLTVVPPLRMLAMVSSPTDYPPLDVAAEWARLDEGMADIVESGLVEIHRLEKATLRELQRALRRTDYHLLHFIGHGGFDATVADGLLLLETDEGRAREVSGRQLGTILDDARTIRLAVLNACEGARTSGADPFAGVAQSLVAKGIPAVVAMQFEISDRAAIIFAHEFYTAITDGFSVEAAVGEARRAIFGSKADVEWGTPVLYMRAEDGRLFDVAERPTLPQPDDQVDDAPQAPPTTEEPVVEQPAEPEAEVESFAETTVGPPVEADTAVPAVEPDAALAEDLGEVLDEVVAGEAEPELVTEVVEDVPPVRPVDDEVEPAADDSSAQPSIDLEPVSDEALPVEHGVGDTQEEEDGDDQRRAVDLKPRRLPTGVLVALVVAAVVALLLFVISRFGDDPGETTTIPPDRTTVPKGGSTIVDPGQQVLDSAVVTAHAPPDVSIDGDLSEWRSVPVAYLLSHPVLNDLTDDRLGEDSTGVMWVAYDAENLYIAVEVDDDVYSQPNDGNQIWRGDALDVNLVNEAAAVVPARPDAHTFQLTMTPLAEPIGHSAVVWFVGNGEAFDENTTDVPVLLEGDVDNDGDWRLEAKIAWSVFGMDGPPPDGRLDAAVFSIFDNDGEFGSNGRSLQSEILTNLPDVFFQEPQTWGSLVTD